MVETQTQTREEAVRTPKLHKYSYIDILRGLAILGVVAVHSSQHVEGLNILVASIFNCGQLGVQLFFVASAITLCLSGAQRSEKSPVNFYIRRFFRIAPLFYAAILFYFLWRGCVQYSELGVVAIPANYSARGILETVFFVHGFDPRYFNFAVPGGWSIAAEMSFYAIFPVLYTVQSNCKKTKFVFFSACVFLICLLIKDILIYQVQPVLVAKGIIRTYALQYDFLEASILNQISVFLVGIICYRYISNDDETRNVSGKMTALGILLIFLGGYLLNSKSYVHTPFTGLLYPVVSAVGFAMLTMRLSRVKAFAGRLSGVLIRVGQVSFSMYILHFFVLDVVSIVFNKSIYKFIELPEIQLVFLYFTALILTFLFSTWTYKAVEKHGIEIGSNLIRKISRRGMAI